MPSDDNRVLPPRNRPGNAIQHNRLAEDGAPEDIADRAVRALPHLLELELDHARLVRRDRRALDADLVLEDRLRRCDRHLVVGLQKAVLL